MDGFTLRRVWRGATYEIVVENPDHLEKGVKAMTVDGKPVSGNILSPVPAGLTVEVKIVMANCPPSAAKGLLHKEKTSVAAPSRINVSKSTKTLAIGP